MQISTKKPAFDDEFISRVNKSELKGSVAQISFDDTHVLVTVIASVRPVGRFSFIIDDAVYLLEKSHIIEREFYPFELAVYELVKVAKKKKVFAICWT